MISRSNLLFIKILLEVTSLEYYGLASSKVTGPRRITQLSLQSYERL